MYVYLLDDNRIGATSSEECEGMTDALQFDFSEDFDFENQLNYKLVNGELVYDPIETQAALATANLTANDSVETSDTEALNQRISALEEQLAQMAEVLDSSSS